MTIPTITVPQLGGKGSSGSIIHDVTAVPGPELGKDGDWAVRKGPGGETTLYGPKVAGMWTAGRSLRGGPGEKGDPPAHQWSGTSIRIMRPDETWGDWTNLVGPPGPSVQGDPGPRGLRGWSPLIVPMTIVIDEAAVIVYRLIDWVGGDAPKPSAYVGWYAAPDGGLVEALADAMQIPVAGASDLPWLATDLGRPFPIWSHLWDDPLDALPPPDWPHGRFVILTAGLDGAGGYNEEALTGEDIAGSGPTLLATADISFPASPFLGRTVDLVNTSGRVFYGGEIAGHVWHDQHQRLTGAKSQIWLGGLGSPGVLSVSPDSANRPTPGSAASSRLSFDSADSPDARAGDRTLAKGVTATFAMRIW